MNPFPTEAELADFRADAEAGMTATIRAYRQTGRIAQDDDTGIEQPEFHEVIAESIAKFQNVGNLSAVTADLGGRREVIDQMRVDLPVSAEQLLQDDIIECLTNPTDPRLEGRKFVVGAPMNKTYSTATRLNVKELPEPAEVTP